MSKRRIPKSLRRQIRQDDDSKYELTAKEKILVVVAIIIVILISLYVGDWHYGWNPSVFDILMRR